MIIALKFDKFARHHGETGAFFRPVDPKIRGEKRFISTDLIQYMLSPDRFSDAAEQSADSIYNYDISTPELKKAWGAVFQHMARDQDRDVLRTQRFPLFFDQVYRDESGTYAKFVSLKRRSDLTVAPEKRYKGAAGSIEMSLTETNINLVLGSMRNFKNRAFIPESQLFKAREALRVHASSKLHRGHQP